MKKQKKHMGRIICSMVILLLVLLILAVLGDRAVRLYFTVRGHGNGTADSYSFTESARQLENPNRGFYHMHGFRINEDDADFRDNIAGRFARDQQTSLTMIEVNLQYFRDKELSEKGLENLEKLFATLATVDKNLIIRFLYDWNGENEKVEPDTIDIILEHMRQAEAVLRKYSDRIFVVQGLFIGNWGEMNGTKFLAEEDLQALAAQLAAVTDEATYLAVRMPAQWRKITRIVDPKGIAEGDNGLAGRIGLYNDGMLGSWSDYGTYGDHTLAENGPFTYWNREEELAFQEVLCRSVPIGGEVIVDNPYNDFENAVNDMKTMHVTYISRDYDTKVLDKWASKTVSENGCFDGMDGLSYIERHLGYRLLIQDTEMEYDFRKDSLTVSVTLQNVGFAPIYKDTDVRIILYQMEEGTLHSYRVEQPISVLAGGNDAESLLTLQEEIPLFGEAPGAYEVYFAIRDSASGEQILLANEQDAESYGYKIGDVTLETVEQFWNNLIAEKTEK